MLSRAVLKLSGFRVFRYITSLFSSLKYFYTSILVLSTISLVHASISAITSKHIKQVIAYSSIVHMNMSFVSLFINKTLSVVSGLYSMISHNFVSINLSAMSDILYARTKSYQLTSYSSLIDRAPVLALLFVITLFANNSIPLTARFVGKISIFLDINLKSYLNIN